MSDRPTYEDIVHAAGVLRAVSVALDNVDWGALALEAQRTVALAPILRREWWRYNCDSIRSNERLFAAARDFVAELHRIKERG